jgi:TolA-binding protein
VPNSGVNLEVAVPDGTITVKGTVFIVEARGQTSSVEVVKGAVSVMPRKSNRPSSEKLDAGRSFSFRENRTTKRVRKDKDNLLELLGISPESEVGDKVEDELASMEAEPADGEEAEDKSLKTADMVRRPAEPASPAVLFKAARACRAKKDWDCAAENYSKVIKHYPNRPDSVTTMVPLAQILLENLKRPAQALDYFRRYQKKKPRGGLGQEALFGECTALKKLGRTKQERRCLERYVELYPNTTYSLMASSRLKNILQQQAPDK